MAPASALCGLEAGEIASASPIRNLWWYLGVRIEKKMAKCMLHCSVIVSSDAEAKRRESISEL